jgi:hypothetical protein
MNPGFWTVFKADLLFGGCSITLSVVLTLAISWWRKRKAQAETTVLRPVMPHVMVIGGKGAVPGHCPLCGNGWPLPGPLVEERPRMDLSFKCPDCGGSSFGSASTTPDPTGPCHRYCHGDDARDGRAGCKFNWPEKDDWKYFTCQGKKVASSQEYEAILEKIRPGPVAGSGPVFPPH